MPIRQGTSGQSQVLEAFTLLAGALRIEPFHTCFEDYTGSGKIALVTGSDSGIGRAGAIGFAKKGANVAIAYLEEHEDTRQTSQYIEQAGRQW